LGQWISTREVDTPFDTQRRAEEVPVAEYVALAQAAAASTTGTCSARSAP